MRAGLAPASGSIVGGFRIDRWLGGGDDTEVWRADGDGIVVALKLLRDPSDVFARARMAREAAALRRIDHEHVVSLFAVGEEDGEPYLATPLLDAGTLASLLDDGRLEASVAAAILAPVASALAAAHAAGVVHRDVKPGNVLLTPAGPVLIDFGAAALDGVTLDGWVEGAPALVATTAYAPSGTEVSPAVDVWSLGVMLLEALTGTTDVLVAIEQGLPDVSAHARALIESCCAADAALRPSAAFVAAQLRSLAGSVSAPSVAAPIVLDDGPTRRGAPTPSSDAPAAHHGRELEVAQLLDMIDAAQAARELRGLLVTAPPGMGKSWLLDSAATRAALGGATVLRAACTEAVNDLRVLAPWVRRVGDHARLVELLGEHHADLVVHVTGVEAGGSVEADPATIADAMAALVGACERPVAVVDDLHHAADDLVDLLGRLAFRPGIAGALWLGARPGFVDGDDLDVRTLALGPLPDDVIVDLAGAEAVELAGGNPLLARELLLARALAPELATELAPALAPLHAATTDVRELIGQRLARVGSAAGAELDLAATCGEVFWPETIGVTMALGLMCRSGLVRLRPDSTIAGSTEAEWTHPLLREVAYDRLDDGTRRDAHVKVAHKLDDAATEPEAIAHHAAAAFELGARDESAFVGDVSSRAARVALDRFALANADRWTSLVRETGHEPVPGTADTLEAELLLRRGEFERSGTLADRWTERADDVGTQALAVSAEAHLATGEYDTAEHAAAAALARIPDSRRRDQLTSTYVELLKRRGDYEQAANLAATAASAARSRGDGAYAARLAVQAATNDVYAANARGAPIIEHVWRSFDALRELQGAGDRRAYVDAAFATATLVAVVDPAAARSLLDDAIDDAEALGAATQLGSLAIHASEIAFELGDVPGARVYAERASRQPLERLQRVYLDSLSASIEIANGSDAPDLLNRVIVAADDPLCDYPTRMFGLTVPMWTGQIASVKRDRFVGDGVIDAIADLSYIALLGPPWAAAFNGTHPPGAANELALLHYLRGEHDAGDALLRTRAAFLTASGSSYERFNVVFPGPLLMALGPPDIAPRIDWLVEQILRPALPNLWAIHRAICAALLAERQHEQARELASAGLAILDRAKPDPVVSTWLTERLGRAFDQ